jgi:hypothetical protein
MKHILIVAVLSATAVTAAVAQGTTAPKLDTVDQILDRYVAAVGGPALQKITSMTLKGTLEIAEMQLNGTIEVSQKAPDKSLQVVSLDPMGAQREGFDGTTAWVEDAQNGIREKTGLELAEARRGAMFPRELNIRKQYPKMTVVGREKVGAREAFVVSATPEAGEPTRLYFDVESGLLLRQILTRHGPQGPAQIDTTFEDYRPIDGVKRAHLIRQANPQFAAVLRITEIKHNVALDDGIFRKPS